MRNEIEKVTNIIAMPDYYSFIIVVLIIANDIIRICTYIQILDRDEMKIHTPKMSLETDRRQRRVHVSLHAELL